MKDDFFRPFGRSIHAETPDELREILGAIDITVPRRTEGPRSTHRERHSIVHYLGTLASHSRLNFPLTVTARERPNFVIEAAGRYGVEATEAGAPRHQQAMTELEKAPPGSFVEAGSHIVTCPGADLGGRGFVGDEPERRWTAEVLRVIKKKTHDLQKFGWEEACDLLVYDNTEMSILTSWTIDELPERLGNAIAEWRAEHPEIARHYRSISVLRDRELMHEVTGEAAILQVPESPLPVEQRLNVSRDDLGRFCRRHQIKKLGFFGSVRDESRFRPESDVDVLVEFEPSARITLFRMVSMEQELGELIGRKVDLRTVPDLSRYFREDVARRKTDLAYVAS